MPRAILLAAILPIVLLAACATSKYTPPKIPASLERRLKADGLDYVLEQARTGDPCVFSSLAQNRFSDADIDAKTKRAFLNYAANRGDAASRAYLEHTDALADLDKNAEIVKIRKLSGTRQGILTALDTAALGKSSRKDSTAPETYHGFPRTVHAIGPARITIVGADDDLKVVSITTIADLSREKYADWEVSLIGAALQAAEPVKQVLWDSPWRGPYPVGLTCTQVRFSEELGTTYSFANGGLVQVFTLSVDPSFNSFSPGYDQLERRRNVETPAVKNDTKKN